MGPIVNYDLSYNFIELHRTFHEIPKNTSENVDIDISLKSSFGKRLQWPDLIKEYRLIILAEAGSGKTTEIHNVAYNLREQGKPAFFLRLEHIPKYFEDSFEVGSFEAFEEWLLCSEEGWLLLDSVDEARLRDPRDFELAIRKLGKRISKALDRTHIVITGRTTAWRTKTDLAHCIAHLPLTMAATSVCDPQPEDNGPEGIVQTETKTQGDEGFNIFKIVTLDDLTSSQIEVFIKERRLWHVKDFLDAVERADAWSFTSRPQDLEELIEFWIDKGRIGTRLELMRNSIGYRLAERDQNRAESCPLSADRARQGARLLAVATTLIQDPTIKVPDGAEMSKGIAIQSVLPDWNEKEQSTLLSRPIFDEAIYGAVRFHTRSVREYLTAEWFDELLKRGTSRRNIEKLFFCNKYGLDIIVPTLRPILPWMAILDEKIREHVCKLAPEIIFEGGDPSQLPLDVRRNILYEVCDQIAEGSADRSMQEYAAVQRFAQTDLTDDVRALVQKYKDNEDLTSFLFRMVWLGQLEGALPETMHFALNPNTDQYTRFAAFRAIKAIGSKEDQEHVRQSFHSEAPDLKREWLAELIADVQPTEQTLAWVLACLEKCEPKKRYTVDHLTDRITEFVSIADIELLPKLVGDLNRLLSHPPMIEDRFCKVSIKFQWLMVPASKAIERLILARHKTSLEPDTLAILHKISTARDYGVENSSEVKAEFSKLVPAWKELNRALFWFEMQRAREINDKKGRKRLTEYWRASIFGSFCSFEESDYEYAVWEISHRTFLDDKLIALSLAFDLYKMANRPKAWRERLKKVVKGDTVLSERLGTYLRPPAQSQDLRRWKQQKARWKRRKEANRKRQENYHKEWKQYLNENLEKIRAELHDKPGIIPNALLYLSNQTREKEGSTTRWTKYNWKTLIPEYGEEIARFYRDAAVYIWRNHEPKTRSEGAPDDKITWGVILGLTGLEIEAHETKDWPKNLRAAEVTHACKFASFALNGFPTWFPRLFEAHPSIVCDFLMQEVHYELSIEKPETNTHYVISDLRWSGQWIWDQIAPSIYKLLRSKEPKNLSNLDNLVKIVQGSALRDELIEEMAYLKCRYQKKLEHVARWFAVWTSVAPKTAISSLRTRIRRIADSERQTLFAMIFITHLLGNRRDDEGVVRYAYKIPEHLKSLYLLMHQYIRRGEDIIRAGTGAYSPGLRDNAQDARNSLLVLLDQIPGKEAFLALMDIAEMHPEESARPWMKLQAKKKAEQDGDIEPWSPSQVRDFNDKLERTPRNHLELAELAILRLLDLKDDLEHGDSSIAGILQGVIKETDMRKFIGRELREKAFGRYSIPQEEEFADGKKPDLRFHGVGFDGPVPAELKLADNWVGPKLFERLENQLCGDYLRDNRSSRGIFVLVYRGKKLEWEVPLNNNRVDFSGLTSALQEHWSRISRKFLNIDDITVIGIDLTKRTNS